jgi:hypothetical protein
MSIIVATSSLRPVRGKFLCPECKEPFKLRRFLGAHRLRAHQIRGTGTTALARRNKKQPPSNGALSPAALTAALAPKVPLQLGSADTLGFAIIYAFAHCETWIEIYANAHGLPTAVVTNQVADLLRDAAGKQKAPQPLQQS